MARFYDHRAADVVISATATIRQGQPEEITNEEHVSPFRMPMPRMWVPDLAVKDRLSERWDQKWFVVWRRVSISTNERTLIPTVLPLVGAGDSIFILLPREGSNYLAASIIASMGTYVVDFVTRQKMGGVNLSYFIFAQLPIFGPSAFEKHEDWDNRQTVNSWIMPRVLELSYTAWDLQSFASDCGYNGPPFIWDEERRFLLRCELDAAYFHLYEIKRDDAAYIMETFPIVKRKDNQKYGDYRTKLVILKTYDDMQKAIETGQPYKTLLDPPPADPRVAHSPRPNG